jgi:hypothetical protein
MLPTVRVKSSDDAVRRDREEAAHSVISRFGNRLPNLPLLCFFDEEDWPVLRGPGMAANRGAYFSSPSWADTPAYIRGCALIEGQPAFDNLIYLHGTTCADEVGLTMTFAHELQHFVQHGTSRLSWAVNTLAYATLRDLEMSDFRALALRTCDIPFEREARMVAKRVAEDLLGKDRVHKHIEAKIAERVTEQDAVDWDCIRGLDVTAPYDLASETQRFFPRLKTCRLGLERELRRRQTDADFRNIDLNALLSGTLVSGT